MASDVQKTPSNLPEMGGILSVKRDVEIWNLKGKRILVVDDIQDNRLLETLLLKKAGASVVIAANGVEAIEKVMAENPDAILMDLHMPLLDGIGATARLRQIGFRKPIIAVTADCQEESRMRAIQVGMNDYISKPISVGSLLEALEKFLSLHETEMAPH